MGAGRFILSGFPLFLPAILRNRVQAQSMQGKTPAIAAVTIGQSPRPDIVREIALFAPGAMWIETGVLDGLDQAEVAALAPGEGDTPLVTRAFGRTVIVGEHAIAGRVRQALCEAASEADAVVLLCSGPFDALGTVASTAPIVVPGRVFDAVLLAVARESRLVVVVPHEGQGEARRRKWDAAGVPVSVICAPPYAETEFAAVGRRAAELGDLVAMDCIGYSLAQRTAVAAASGLPTVLAALARSGGRPRAGGDSRPACPVVVAAPAAASLRLPAPPRRTRRCCRRAPRVR